VLGGKNIFNFYICRSPRNEIPKFLGLYFIRPPYNKKLAIWSIRAKSPDYFLLFIKFNKKQGRIFLIELN